MDLKNKTHLYAIGCSHMVGSEISGPGVTERVKVNVLNSWSGQLAKQYSLNYINHSEPGSSNEFAMRSTIDFVSKWLHEGRDPTELFVVVGWTTNERVEFTWDDKHVHWANGSDAEWYKESTGGDFTTWFKALQLYHTDYNFGLFKKMTYMNMVNSFLKSVGVDHIQVNNCASIDANSLDHLRLRHLEHTFPNDIFFEKHNSFIERYNTKDNTAHFTSWLHADKHIHTLYATDVKQFIEEL
jgi:hypothetical protein